MITKKSSLEEDSKFLRDLLKKAVTTQKEFRRLVVNTGTHGQQAGLPIRGRAYLNEYKKCDKKYRYNYEKANKKYFDKGGAYSLVVACIEEIKEKE